MEIRPIIYSMNISSKNVTTKEKVTISVVVDEIETFYSERNYAMSNIYELVAGQEIGVI